jgi:serine/threonine protein kinase
MASDSIQIPGYEILRPLGVGGMSTVYLALQRSLDRKVAVKVMRRTGDSDDAGQTEKRFLLEGRMLAKLPHRNIVAVYDIVSNEHLAYIAMEYLDGGVLSDRMRMGLSLAEAVSVIVQIANALEFAHKQGVVHRDLKPANIMFRDNGTPVLTDFGIARFQDASAMRLTQTGMLVGTPSYMSPEQINGAAVDGRSDQYSLGILFYELLTGAPPFRAETSIAVLMAHLQQPVPPLPPEFISFQPILDRMLAKNRDDRYADMQAFVQELKTQLQSQTMQLRLQIDPNLSASEQLRALGFSISSQNASLPGLRQPSAQRASEPPVRKDDRSGPRGRTPLPPAFLSLLSRRGWIAVAAIAVVIALALGIWSFSGESGLSKDDRRAVSSFLDSARKRIEENKLVGADDSAAEFVRLAQQKDPRNAQAKALLDQIVQSLRDQAQQKLVGGKLDEASAIADQGLQLRPNDADFLAFKKSIEQARKTAQTKAQVQKLLNAAGDAEAKSRNFGDENSAYSLLLKARGLAKDDPDVAKRLDAFVNSRLEPIRSDLRAGNPGAAATGMDELKLWLDGEPAYVKLNGEIQSFAQKQQTERKIADQLGIAQEQLRAGRLSEPGGNNAFETLETLKQLDGGNAQVGAFAKQLAAAFYAEAKKLDAAGSADRALDQLGLALKIYTNYADAQTLSDQIGQRLGQRRMQISAALGAAQQAIAEKRFVPPDANDARGALDTLLKLDPNNTLGKTLLDELPQRIADSANDRARNKDAAGAAALVKAAQKAFPQDATFAALAQKFDAQVRTEKAARLAADARDRVNKILALTPPTPELLRDAASNLATLASNDPDGSDLTALRKRYLDLVSARLQVAQSASEFDALAAPLKDFAATLKGDANFTSLTQGLAAQRTRIAAAEKARLDAERGELVLNAAPWGKVESVLDANGQAVELPADRSTPLIVSVVAGTYKITFSHPQAAQPVQITAVVEAKKRVLANTTFALSSQGYFQRAGW